MKKGCNWYKKVEHQLLLEDKVSIEFTHSVALQLRQVVLPVMNDGCIYYRYPGTSIISLAAGSALYFIASCL